MSLHHASASLTSSALDYVHEVHYNPTLQAKIISNIVGANSQHIIPDGGSLRCKTKCLCIAKLQFQVPCNTITGFREELRATR